MKLTPSLLRCHLKTANKSAQFETLKPFFFFFTLLCEKIFIAALKADVLQDQEIHHLQVRPRIFQPVKFPGWGSEGVNGSQ